MRETNNLNEILESVKDLVPVEEHRVLTLLLNNLVKGLEVPNLLFTGRPGTGKTFLMKNLQNFFQKSNILTHWVNIQFCIYDPETHLMGTTVLLDGKTQYIPSPLITFLKNPGKKVLFIDEINRATPEVLDLILPLTDFRKEFYTRGEIVSAGDLTVIGSMNLHRSLDEALSDRFLRVGFAYPSSDVFFNSLRKKLDISLRTEKLAKQMSLKSDGTFDKEVLVQIVKMSSSFNDDDIAYINQCAMTIR